MRQILIEETGEQSAPTLDEMEALITGIISAMYDETQDRVAARLQDVEWRFNQHNRIDAAGANPLARTEMDKTWRQAKDPLRLASGKAILSRIRAVIQEKWKVSFGNARIIEVMRQADVHQDIKDLLERAKKALL